MRDKQGIFKTFGLDVAPIFIDGGSMLTQAVVGGSVDIAQNGYTPALSAAVQGADIVIVGGISNKLPFQLVVKTSITTAQQLKGHASPSAATAPRPTPRPTSRSPTSSSPATT